MSSARSVRKGKIGSLAAAIVGIAAIALSVGFTELASSPHYGSPAKGAGPVAERPSSSAGDHRAYASLPARPSSYLGVYEAASPDSYQQVLQFGRTIGTEPNIALYFSSLSEPFQSHFAADAEAHGATPAVQIDPLISNAPVSLSGLAAGRFDPLLKAYADQVASFGHAVIIGFAHEPNGFWYQWGENYVKPAVWIAAWRHVVDVFRKQGADNVIWLWTMNLESSGTLPISDWWPGASYVTWIGLDGYYGNTTDTFQSIFSSAITTMRRITHAPILVAETGVDALSSESLQIRNLFTAIRHRGCLGLIWFDKDTPRAIWRLEGNQPAIRAFRQQAGSWTLEHSM
jgi:mannan endo-1,4-beta-mannosidase